MRESSASTTWSRGCLASTGIAPDARRRSCRTGRLAAQVLAGVPDMGLVVVNQARIQSCQHRGLVDLQQEHLAEAVGQFVLIVRTAADVQRRWR